MIPITKLKKKHIDFQTRVQVHGHTLPISNLDEYRNDYGLLKPGVLIALLS